MRRPKPREFRPYIDELQSTRHSKASLTGFRGGEFSTGYGQKHEQASGIGRATLGAFWIIRHVQTIPEQNANGDAFRANQDKKPTNNQKLMFQVRAAFRLLSS
jgi:hypothetical protein